MIRPIYERLSVGDEHGAGYATVHACKHPCHKERCGQPKPGDDNYLSYAEGDHLYLNMIDPEKPLFQLPMFIESLKWMRDRYEEGKELLVHCNQGKSRSPSLAMLFLAKVLKVIPCGSYDEAVSEFVDLYPDYAPGMGIKLYMAEHWDRITIEEPAAKVSSFKRATIPDETNAYTLEEIDLIASDPELWGRLHGYIEDRETKQPIKFKPSPLQRRALAHYRRCRDTCRDCGVTTCSCPLDRRGVPVRIVMPKIRRGGGSTVAQLIMYVHAHNYVSRLATIGTRHQVSLNMFKMCRFFDKHDSFEHWPRATKILETGEISWPNGSSWEMYTAENPESARSAGLQGYHACVPGDTPVLVEHGRVKRIDEVQPGDIVLTHTGQRTRVKATVGKPNQKGALVKITPWLGMPVSFTWDHKIPTARGMLFARDIQPGDEVSMPIRPITSGDTPPLIIPTQEARKQGGGRIWRNGGKEIPKNRETGFFFGYYLAEGHVKSNHGRYTEVSFSRHRSEEAFSKRAIAAVQEFIDSAFSKDHKGTLRSTDHLYGGGFARLVEEHFGRVGTKHVPDWVFNAGEEFCLGLLEGYLSGDGSKTVPDCKGNGRLNRVVAPTIHSSIATQIRDIAASLGFGWAGLSWKPAGNYHGRNCREQWRLAWNGDSGKKLAQLIGGQWVEKRRRFNGDKPKWRIEGDRVWIKVRKVESDEADTVWDLEVEHEDHTFRTPWFAVSNTEVGRWQDGGSTDARETLRSMLAAVPKRGFTVVIEESTAQGAQGAFYDRFMSARWPEYAQWWRTWEDEYTQQIEKIGAREQFVRIFAAWFEDDENKPDEPLTEEQIQHIQRTLTDKERALIDRYGNEGPQGMRLGTEAEVATLWQQLAWRRSVIKSEFSGDIQGFEQEYPSSPKEAFASSGRRTFNADGVQYMIEVAKSRRPRKGILTKQNDGQIAFSPTDDSGAWIQVWQEPRPGHSYLGYADVMTGAEQIKGSSLFDFHASGILRADHFDEHGRRHPIEQVCSLIPESTVEHDILAWQTYLMSLWYGGCMIVPEINGPGHGYLSELRKLGANIYQRQSIDKITGMSTDRLGWVTDTNTRPAIITHMQTLMRNNADEGTRSAGIIVNCPYAAQQFSTIVKDAKGKDAAAPRTHDDEVLALCIGAYNIAQATRLPHRVRKRQKPADLNHWKAVG